MTQAELQQLLSSLITMWESEVVERGGRVQAGRKGLRHTQDRTQVGIRKANVSESLMTCRDDYQHDIETGVSGCPRDEPGGSPLTGQVVSGMKATRAWSAAAAWNVGRPVAIRSPLWVARGHAFEDATGSW